MGCGDKTVTVERHVTVEQAPPQPKQHHHKTPPAPVKAAFVNCDANIEAKAATTTCPFAENVFWTYWTDGQSSSPAPVWSPAAHASFETTCEGSVQVVCTTSDNAVVRFSQTAVDAYSATQADTYAGSHDLGPDPYEGLPPQESSGDGGGADCQGYDPCIEPGDDVDCVGGSGDGPRYVSGPVYVNGDDPYALDGNYDGVGCEY